MNQPSIPDLAAELTNALNAATNCVGKLRSIEMQLALDDRYALTHLLDEARKAARNGIDTAFGIAIHVQEIAEKRIKAITPKVAAS